MTPSDAARKIDLVDNPNSRVRIPQLTGGLRPMRDVVLAPAQIPRLPVVGWNALCRYASTIPSGVLDAPRRLLPRNGRAAIAIALRERGVERGDEVLVPTYYCPTMIAPVMHPRALPIFYPIGARGEADLTLLKAFDLRREKVMLAVHYFGIPQMMAAVRRFCDALGIGLIEDCAHSPFGLAVQRPVRCWGDVA